MLCTLSLLVGLAQAQEAPATPEAQDPAEEPAETEVPAPPPTDTGSRPLALPAQTPSPAAAGKPMAQAGSPPPSPERLRLLRTYRQERLVLRGETEFHQGPATAWTTGWGYGGYGGWGGYYGTTVISNPVWTTRTWGIYQGPERLSTPRFLEVAGQPGMASELQGTIDRKRRYARTWYTVAGVGAAGILTGIVGMGQAQDRETWYIFNDVALAGVGLTVGGMIGGSFPSAKASRLHRYPSSTLSAGQAQEYVDAHNEQLQAELGLSAQEVWAFEIGAGEQR